MCSAAYATRGSRSTTKGTEDTELHRCGEAAVQLSRGRNDCRFAAKANSVPSVVNLLDGLDHPVVLLDKHALPRSASNPDGIHEPHLLGHTAHRQSAPRQLPGRDP